MVRTERLEADQWVRLQGVRLRALHDAPDAFGSTVAQERDAPEEQWRHLLGLGPWWVAATDDGDVGVVAGGHHAGTDDLWVYSMWVQRDYRGEGVAELLLGEVVAWAVAEGAGRLGLDVTDRVPRARRFYERHGFIASGVTFPLPRDPSILLVEMTLDLCAVSPGGWTCP